MEAPGSQEGWDKPGSLGEIVALLRKLQVLLDVYSFGPPDLPDAGHPQRRKFRSRSLRRHYG